MDKTFEVKIEQYIKEAWAIFIKSPEVFVVWAMILIALNYLANLIPFPASLLSLVVTAFGYPAMFFMARSSFLTGKASFADSQQVVAYLPSLVFFVAVASTMVTIGLICLVIPGVYLFTSYIFAPQFVIFKNMGFWQAMEASRKMVGRNWFGIFGLTVVSFLIFFSGILLIGVGVLFTAPMMTLILYCAFQDITHQIQE